MTLASILILLVAFFHTWIFILESFLWQKPVGLKTFQNSPEKAKATAVLAINQGVYNAFLAAGLFWAAATARTDLGIFFLGCVIVAGIVGGATVNRKIFFVQGLPAIVAMACLLAS
jgi:putative membrane protein